MQTDVGGKSIGKKIHELQTRSVDKLVEFCVAFLIPGKKLNIESLCPSSVYMYV